MVDDGFLIGFEDSSGNFVEVGRFNNTADDVTQPLEIKHQNSGERITLDSSGFETRSVTSTDSVTVTDGEATNTLHYGSNQDRANAGNNGTAIGIGARASRDDVTASGAFAARNNTSRKVTASGVNAARNNTGNRVTTSGLNAARNNTGNRVTASGQSVALNNTGNRVTASGVNAALDNTGNDLTASGQNAARDNTGNRVTASGQKAALSNTGNRVTASGQSAALNNTGNRVTASGVNAARGDGLSDPTTMGDDNIGIGVSAIRNNQASGLIAIGQEAGINAQTDDQLIITDRNGNRRMVMDLQNGDLKIDGSLTQNATL
jgi:hypothetical protein